MLEKQQRFNNGILLTAITMVGIVFLLGIGVILLYRHNLTAVSVAFGGNLFSLLVTVAWIRRLWIEKGIFDLARLAAEELPPKEAIELASVMYWRVLKKE
jgi:O-antigen/teichoic acid export membrane protein